MYIEKLILTDFGKFKDRSIDFNRGLNLIYGQNESGKSTIHNFIGGMFYGFAKIGAKRKNYKEELSHYMPWNGENYRGSILLNYENQQYRIDRSFLKNKDYTKIYNYKTGKDITKEVDLLEHSKVEQPGLHFFGISQSLFENTLYISQMNIKTTEDIRESLNDRFINFNTSKDENISIEKATKYLDEQIKEIGTDLSKKSDLGFLKNRLENLNNSLIANEGSKDKYNSSLEELNKHYEEKIKILEGLEYWTNQHNVAEKKKEHEIYLKVQSNFKKIKKLNLEIENYDKDNELINDYNSYLDKSSFLKICKAKKNDIILNNNSINEDVLKEDTINTKIYPSLDEDIRIYGNLINEEIQLNKTNYSKEREFLNMDINNIKFSKKKLILLIVCLFALCISLLVFAVSIKNYFLLLLLIFPGIYIYLRLGNLRRTIELIKRLEIQMDKLKEYSFIKKKRRDEMDSEIEKLFDKYKFDNRASLEDFFNRSTKVEQEKEYKNKFNRQLLESNLNLLEEYENSIKITENEISGILKKYYCHSYLHFEQMAKEKSLDNLLEEKKKILELNTAILGERDFESLKHEDCKSLEIESIEKIEKNLLEFNSNLKEVESNISKVEERVTILEDSIKLIQNIKDDITHTEEKYNILLNKRKELELARNILLEISVENRENFAPELNREISKILSHITKGKYMEIIMDADNEIRVLDKEHNKFVSIRDLSMGTIDQVYISTRLAILEVLGKKNTPIILDDSFNQFDDIRLMSILKALYNLKEERQIIIFTSQKREIKILEEIGEDFNLINI